MIVTPEEENIQSVRILIQGLNHIIFIIGISSIGRKSMEREVGQNENRLFLICLCKCCEISFQLLNIFGVDSIRSAPGLRAEAVDDIIIGIDVDIRNTRTLNIFLCGIGSIFVITILGICFMIAGRKIRLFNMGIVLGCVEYRFRIRPILCFAGHRRIIAAEAHSVKFFNSKLTGYGIEPVGYTSG